MYSMGIGTLTLTLTPTRWTPSLERRAARAGMQMGHGLVFSIFMLCKMVGFRPFNPDLNPES